ncbi:MAG: acetate--CoA ligase family protein [Halobacteria archaeon]|nr:acetate--CoA ligase family protein [Halobacteria archaeon]
MSDPMSRALDEGRDSLTEPESKDLLAEHGITVPEYVVAESAEEAVKGAEKLGYPVVVKVCSHLIHHKAEWGGDVGVNVGLENAEEVRDASENIKRASEKEGIDVSILVEEQVDREGGTEVIVGGTRDPSFGPVLLFGLGGVFTEVLEDVSHRLAPLSEEEVYRMVNEIKGVKLLKGYRNTPPADFDNLVSTVRIVGDLLAEHSSIQEIDINPLLAGPDGVVVLDAMVFV